MKIKKLFIDLLFYIVGSFIYSVALTMFISPAQISPGGFTGLALIINYLIKIPTGMTIFILNIPLVLIAAKKFGKHFILGTAIATSILSLIIDICEKFIGAFEGDLILSSIFGGILMGVGLGLVLFRGATTGGIDIIGKLINDRFPFVSIGRTILLGDTAVIILSAIFHRNFSASLYSAVTVFITSVVVDKILYGSDGGKLIYIVTAKAKEISKKIITEVGRGVTIIEGTGAYSGENRQMLMCAVRVHQVSVVSKLAQSEDEGSFIIVCDATEIRGYGFNKK
ncbi:MAG: YitT family protein [Ruminococcaceae bacterium]|nr:YitT family protein [Oscillospiraceae bacterium]